MISIGKNKEKVSWIGRMLGHGGYEDLEEEVLDDALEEMLDEIPEEESLGDDDLEENALDILEDTNEEQPMPARTGADDLQINLIDKGDSLVAQALVPGVEETKIEIDLNREMLTITAGSNEHWVEKDGDYLYEELSFGSFSRSLLLPAEVEVEDAKAEVKDGILTITMPKIDKAAHKKLSVKKR